MSNPQNNCTKCGAHFISFISTVRCGSNCLECGRYSFSADEPSYLYFLTNHSLDLHKVGIGRVGDDRGQLQRLIESGWELHGIWHTREKRKTFQWEKSVYKQLAMKFSKAGLQTSGFSGQSDKHWSENISANGISLSDLATLISKIVQGK